MRIREWIATARSVAALRRALVTAAVMTAVVAGGEGRALALQGGEDPALLPVLLDKRYGGDDRQRASLMFTTAVITKLVEDVGVVGTYQYNFFDMLGVGITAGYFAGSETNIATRIRAAGENPSCTPGVPSQPFIQQCPDDKEPLSDLYQLQWLASADIIFVPIYGKISFASELNPSFELYIIGGVGAGGVRRKHLVAGGGTEHDTKITLIANAGLGMRFHIMDWIGIRAEFRNYAYPEPAEGASGVTWNPHFQAGVEFTFGGED